MAKTFNVSKDLEFRRSLAEKIVETDDDFYCGPYWLAHPEKAELKSTIVNPYFTDLHAREGYIPIIQFFNSKHDYSVNRHWDFVEIPGYREMVEEYLVSQGESDIDLDDDTIPDWVFPEDVAEFARKRPEFSDLIKQAEEKVKESAIEFAFSQILNSVEVED